MSRRPQPLAARRLDAAALLVLVAGAVVFGSAILGMRRLERVRPAADVRAGTLPSHLAAYERYVSLARTGAAIVGVGLALALAGAVVTERDRRRRTARSASGLPA